MPRKLVTWKSLIEEEMLGNGEKYSDIIFQKTELTYRQNHQA